jgi:signal transduction histidine kinase
MTSAALRKKEQWLSQSDPSEPTAATDLQDRLHAAEQALAQAKVAREMAVRSKADFIASISHELRTPLQSIIGFSELGASLAQEHPAHAHYGDMFSDIFVGGQRMLSLVNALLDVSALSSNVGSLSLQRVDLIELMECMLAAARSQTSPHAIQISFDHPATPVWAMANPARLQQVLGNVLANARKFGALAGSARIELECKALDSEWTEISVRDHGRGIPADELEAVFEPFVQSSRTRDGSGGVGLGLTVCRKIMAAHGGSIEAAHAAGGGTLIRIVLQACSTPPEAAV